MTIYRTTLNNVRTSFYRREMTNNRTVKDDRRFATEGITEWLSRPRGGPWLLWCFGKSSFDTLSATNLLLTHRNSTNFHLDNRICPVNKYSKFQPWKLRSWSWWVSGRWWWCLRERRCVVASRSRIRFEFRSRFRRFGFWFVLERLCDCPRLCGRQTEPEYEIHLTVLTVLELFSFVRLIAKLNALH